MQAENWSDHDWVFLRAVAQGSLVMSRRLSSIVQLTLSQSGSLENCSGMLRPRSLVVPSAQGFVFGKFCRFLSKVVQLLGFNHSSSHSCGGSSLTSSLIFSLLSSLHFGCFIGCHISTLRDHPECA